MHPFFSTLGRAIAAAVIAIGLASSPALANGGGAHVSVRGYSAPKLKATPGIEKPKGYTLPTTGRETAKAPRMAMSASDAAISRHISGDGLKNYRLGQERAAFAQQAKPAAVPETYSRYRGSYRSYDDWADARTTFYARHTWQAPVYVYQSSPTFGAYDALYFWWLLDHVAEGQHSAWFYNHGEDPAYLEWRTEANRLATENADLRAKLDDLDARTKDQDGKPRDITFLPDDIPPELTLAPENVVAESTDSASEPAVPLLPIAAAADVHPTAAVGAATQPAPDDPLPPLGAIILCVGFAATVIFIIARI